MARYKNSKDKQIKQAQAIIDRLFYLIDNADYKVDDKLKTRYIYLARKIAMKFRLKLNKEQKMRYCTKCHHYINPLKSKHRVKNKISIKCSNCGHERIIHLNK